METGIERADEGIGTYIVGIDLGTTNCALAFANPGQGAEAPVVDFAVPQLCRAGEVAALPLLPSCLYVAGDHELPPGSLQLPWGESPRLIVGAFARWQGARVPGRLVASAKSWLCHAGVDRSAAILPWGARTEVEKISPWKPPHGSWRTWPPRGTMPIPKRPWPNRKWSSPCPRRSMKWRVA